MTFWIFQEHYRTSTTRFQILLITNKHYWLIFLFWGLLRYDKRFCR
jgi:hypothetical protein